MKTTSMLQYYYCQPPPFVLEANEEKQIKFSIENLVKNVNIILLKR